MSQLNIVVGVLVLALIIWRQLSARPAAADRRTLVIVAVVGVAGVVQIVAAARTQPAPAVGWAAMALGLLVGAAVGVARARTVRLWWADGQLWRQGTALTLLWWLVGLALHIGLDAGARVLAPTTAAVNSASILLFLAVSLGAQAVVQVGRARAMSPSPA